MIGDETGDLNLQFDPNRSVSTVDVDDWIFENGALFVGCSGLGTRLHQEMPAALDDIHVHQTLANSTGVNGSGFQSSLRYAVGRNEMRDVVVCGHEDCQYIQDSLKTSENAASGQTEEELVALRKNFREPLLNLSNNKQRADRLAKLNVQYQVRRLIHDSPINDTVTEAPDVRVHGWYWSVEDQSFLDLGLTREVIP